MKKNVAFTFISFAVLKWDDCLSVQLPFDLHTGSDTGSVASKGQSVDLETKLSSRNFSQKTNEMHSGPTDYYNCYWLIYWPLELELNLLVQNVIELEFGLSRM